MAREATEAESGRPDARRLGKFALKLAVSVGLLAYLLRLVDLPSLLAAFARVDPPWLAAAFALYLAGQALSAIKWGMLAEAAGLGAPLARFISHYFVGMYFNVFGLGTLGGDVVRALLLAKGSGRRTLALNTVLADRVSGLLVLLAIALVSLLLFRTYELPAPIYWTTIALSASLLGGWRLAPRVLPLLLSEENWFRRLVEKDLAPYWSDWTLLARVSVLSAVFHLSQIGVLVLLAKSLGIGIPATYYFIFGPLVNVFSALPISINGLGVREGTTVFFLTHVGVPAELAVAFSLSWFGLVLASAGVGALVYLRGDDVDVLTNEHAKQMTSRESTSL